MTSQKDGLFDAVEMLSEHEGDSGIESTNSADSMLYIRIAVPDLNIQVNLHYIHNGRGDCYFLAQLADLVKMLSVCLSQRYPGWHKS